MPYATQRHTIMMQSQKSLVLLICLVAALNFASGVYAQHRSQTVLVHYMPWYASKPVSGHWGWHWTMDHFRPDNVKPNGLREVASHDYPLIDLYDSGDPDVLECHVLLMKLAGDRWRHCRVIMNAAIKDD